MKNLHFFTFFAVGSCSESIEEAKNGIFFAKNAFFEKKENTLSNIFVALQVHIV